ncbi:MAG: hypothetical protein LJF15_06260 [Acidobacteria bacterium]|jgi:hypothetical protein|nr:hypothetical protein [Acidobacteriota bacterium]
MSALGNRGWITALVLLGLSLLAGVVFVLPPHRVQILPADYERTVYSQAGEDGILEKIFELIPPTARFCIEFGAGDGLLFSNVRKLIVHEGWGGLLIEGDGELAEILARNYQGFPGVRTTQAWVFPGNVELLFEENDVPRDLDLLVIDIDSNDYYVWRAIREYRPKVVQIEYNGVFLPPQKVVVGFHPMLWWDEESVHFGASIQSFYELGKRKGYELVAANEVGSNLFFVDGQYYERFGIEDNSPERLFRPFNFDPPLGPQDLHLVMTEDGRAKPPAEDIVLDEVRIQKRFRFDR